MFETESIKKILTLKSVHPETLTVMFQRHDLARTGRDRHDLCTRRPCRRAHP